MPEQREEYRVEQEPELICPFRMHANLVNNSMHINTCCFKENCAWWMQSLQLCSIQAIPDCIGGLMDFMEEQ